MSTQPRFRDRKDAGGWLAVRLSALALHQPVVVAMPRGGIPVAAEVARHLHASFDVLAVRKFADPDRDDLVLGAVAEGDVVVLTEHARRNGDRARVQALAEEARREVRRLVSAYRPGRRLPEMRGRDVVLVDDGMDTGVTAEVALKALRQRNPLRLVLAVPVCVEDAHGRLSALADDVICVLTPSGSPFSSWYDDCSPATDEQLLALLPSEPA